MSVWVNSSPNIELPSTNSSANWATWVYKHRETGTGADAGKEIFDVDNGSGWQNSTTQHAIYVDTDSDTWYDYGAHQPSALTPLANGDIQLYHSNGDLLFQFSKPTAASWISSSGSGSGGGNTSSGGNSSSTSSKKRVFHNFW